MKTINPKPNADETIRKHLAEIIKLQSVNIRARAMPERISKSLIDYRSNRIVSYDEVEALAYIMNEATLDDGVATVGSDKDIMYIGNLDVRVLSKHMIWRKP